MTSSLVDQKVPDKPMKSMGQRLRYGVKTGRRPKLDGSRDCGRNSLRQPEVEAGSTFQPIHSTGPEARLPLDRKRSPIHFAKIFFQISRYPHPVRVFNAWTTFLLAPRGILAPTNEHPSAYAVPFALLHCCKNATQWASLRNRGCAL